MDGIRDSEENQVRGITHHNPKCSPHLPHHSQGTISYQLICQRHLGPFQTNPRIVLGAHSAAYTGVVLDFAPTANPRANRAINKLIQLQIPLVCIHQPRSLKHTCLLRPSRKKLQRKLCKRWRSFLYAQRICSRAHWSNNRYKLRTDTLDLTMSAWSISSWWKVVQWKV